MTVAGIALAGTAGTDSHSLRPGDTLSQVAANHGVSVAELAEANGVGDPNRVPAGMELKIPGRAEEPSQAKRPKGARDRAKAPDAGAGGTGGDPVARPGDAGSGEARVHTVAPGDSLSAIAARYGVTVRTLAEANGIPDVHRIVVGQRLAVPGTGAGLADPPPPNRPGGVDVSRLPALLRSSPERMALIPSFRRWAEASKVPTDLLMATTWLESGWQDDVVSSAGAVGVGQLMPDTAKWISQTLLRTPLDPKDADDNIRMSAAFLRWLLDRTGGDHATALAGYYQGLGAVQSVGVFPSTRVYVADVLAFRDRYF